MILIVNSDAEERSAWAALDVIHRLRGDTVYPTRPDTEDRHWVKTRWANERYL
jgi:hypothetical protein